MAVNKRFSCGRAVPKICEDACFAQSLPASTGLMGFAEGGAAEATGNSPCLPPILEDGAACPIFAIAVETGTTELLPLPLSSDAPGLDRKLSVRHAYDD